MDCELVLTVGFAAFTTLLVAVLAAIGTVSGDDAVKVIAAALGYVFGRGHGAAVNGRRARAAA